MDMKIALVLNAINNMGSVLTNAKNQIKDVERQVKDTASRTKDIKFFDNAWLDKNIKMLNELKKKSQEMQVNGAVQVGKGLAEMKPVKDAVTAAGDFQDVMVEIKTAIYDANIPLKEQEELLSQIDTKALKLGADTRYSNMEAAQAMLVLLKGGAQVRDVLDGSAEAAMNLAQAGKVMPDFAAEAMVKIGNAYNIQGAEMLKLADSISRVDSASTASIGSLVEGMKYASAVSSMLGQSYQDTLLALGALNNAGIDGSNAGTNYADFLRRLAPETPMAIKMQAKLGLSTLSPEEVAKIKKGQDMLNLAGKDVFHDESGKLKPLEEIIKTLREHTKGLRADVVQVAFDKMFGVEGGRAAMALLKEGKGSIEEISGSYNRQMSLNDRISEQQKTFNANLEQLKGSWETLLTTSGTPLLGELANMLKSLTGVVNKTMEWTQAHPKETAMILKAVAGLAMFNITMGATKLAFGNILGVFSSSASSFLGLAKGAGNAVSFFKAFRGTAGIGEVLSQSIAFGFPKASAFFSFVSGSASSMVRIFGLVGGSALKGIVSVAKLGAGFIWTGIQSLLMGARMAAAWLIGLGPIGWIIAAVTVIVGVAIAAWKTNFLGFRDKAMAVWEWIKNAAVTAWNFIKPIVMTVINAIIGYVKFMFSIYSAIWNGIVTVVKAVVNIFLGIWRTAVGAVTAVWGWMAAHWKQIITVILILLGPIGWAIILVVGVIRNNWNTIKAVTIAVFMAVGNFFVGLWNGIKTAALSVWNAIMAAVQFVANIIQVVWTGVSAALSLVWNGIKTVALFVWDAILAAVRLVAAGVQVVWNAVSSVLLGIWDGIKTAATTVWDGISSVISGVGNAIKGVWNGIFSWFSEKFEWVKNTISAIADNPVFKAIGNAGKTVVNAVGGGINKVTDFVFGSHATGLDRVPFDGYIAELHKGEMVLPASVAETVRQARGAKTGGFSAAAAGVKSFTSTASGRKPVPVLKNSTSSYQDKRNVNYYIQSTDPRLAAMEVSRSNGDDKYKKSRDPKLMREAFSY